ncbi:hypothetical protein J3A83DRAFT_3542357 [Scleroderma citrinum]
MSTRRPKRTTLVSPPHSFGLNSAPIDPPAHSKRFHLASTTQTTTIIVIVLGAIGGCILLLSLYRFIRHLCTRRSAPLPPVQPIAHHRQQQLALFAERSITPTHWPYLSTPQEFSPYEGSISLPPSKALSQPVSPLIQASIHSGENSLTESPPSSSHHRIPKLLGDHRRNSLSSVGSASLIPPSATHSSTHTSQNRRRLYSSASYTSTTSRSTVGLPHGPHSQVKIMLPAPLALTASDTGSSINIRPPVPADHWQNQGSIRLSVADMWAPTLHRTTSSDHIVPASTRPRGRLSKSASPSRQRTRLAQSASSNNVSRAPSPLNSEPLE